MCGRKLKNFDVYLQKLEHYAKASRLKLEYCERITCGGLFIPSKRKIVVESDLTDSDTIATILHELGHSIDDSLLTQGSERTIDKAYTAFAKGTHTPEQKRNLMHCERRAWRFGKAIAKRLQIKLGKWYADSRQYALKSYGRN